MKVNLLLCICLALLIFCVPLAALEANTRFADIEETEISSTLSASTSPESVSSLSQSQAQTSSISQSIYITSSSVPTSSSKDKSEEPPSSTSESRDNSLPTLIPSSSTMEEGRISEVILPDSDSFTIYDLTTGELHTLSAQEYTVCAVSAEMPPTFSEEALKAQAVACYTYALRAKYDNAQQPDPSLKGADFAADPSDWKGYVEREQYLERYGEESGSVYWDTIEQAVQPVLGYVMLYQENPIAAAYHSICAGKTEDASNVWQGSAPYLVPVESIGDQYAPNYETAELFSPEGLREALSMAGLMSESSFTGEPVGWFSDFERSSSGYVTALTLCGEQLEGMEVRNALGLRSANFTVEYINGSFLFRVCGYGHGVGMSQYGAEYLGKNGKSWRDILNHYYTGIQIAKAAAF